MFARRSRAFARRSRVPFASGFARGVRAPYTRDVRARVPAWRARAFTRDVRDPFTAPFARDVREFTSAQALARAVSSRVLPAAVSLQVAPDPSVLGLRPARRRPPPVRCSSSRPPHQERRTSPCPKEGRIWTSALVRWVATHVQWEVAPELSERQYRVDEASRWSRLGGA